MPYFSFSKLLAIDLTRSAFAILVLRIPESRDLSYSSMRNFSTLVTFGFVWTIVRYNDKLAFSKSLFLRYSLVC